jgi:hypothetical protein
MELSKSMQMLCLLFADTYFRLILLIHAVDSMTGGMKHFYDFLCIYPFIDMICFN